MREIKLIVTDLDGTFTTNKYEFPERNAQAVARAQAKGILVCACTARNFGLAKGQVRRAGFDRWLIACNGASLVDLESGLMSHCTTLPRDEVAGLLERGVSHGAKVAIYTHEQILFLDGYAAPHYQQFPSDWETKPRDLHIPVTRCHSVQEMRVLGEEGAQLIEWIKPGGLMIDEAEQKVLDRFSCTNVGGHCTHIMQAGVSKLEGVKALCAQLGIEREQVMTVGDNANDVGMLRWAGLGVAVGDGDEAAKAAADEITLPHGDGGFAAAVERFVL